MLLRQLLWCAGYKYCLPPNMLAKTMYPVALRVERRDGRRYPVYWLDLPMARQIAADNAVGVLIVVAEEFPLHLLAGSAVSVFHFPVSEHFDLCDNNLLAAPDRLAARVVQRRHRAAFHNSGPLRVDEVIDRAPGRVAVACMAGRNRSAASLVRYLMLRRALPLPAALGLLQRNAQREATIFPLNMLQLHSLAYELGTRRTVGACQTCADRQAK